jgi:hypothetical protein
MTELFTETTAHPQDKYANLNIQKAEQAKGVYLYSGLKGLG